MATRTEERYHLTELASIAFAIYRDVEVTNELGGTRRQSEREWDAPCSESTNVSPLELPFARALPSIRSVLLGSKKRGKGDDDSVESGFQSGRGDGETNSDLQESEGDANFGVDGVRSGRLERGTETKPNRRSCPTTLAEDARLGRNDVADVGGHGAGRVVVPKKMTTEVDEHVGRRNRTEREEQPRNGEAIDALRGEEPYEPMAEADRDE